MRLPGRCQVCSRDIVWTGKMWRDPGKRGMGRHVCPTDRPRCNAVMYADQRCGRKPGHRFEHRSDYAMENDRARRTRAA